MDSGLSMDSFDLAPEAVRRRFQWAERKGNPLWPWPETSAEGWQAAVTAIAEVSRDVLQGCSPRPLAGDPDDIGIAAFTSGMGPMLGYWSAVGVLDAPAPVRAVLELHYRHNSLRMGTLASEATVSVRALADAGIAVTVLKGMHLAYSYFPAPGTRPVSDIDLMIDAAQEPAAATVLGELGFLPESRTYGEQSWRRPDTPHDLPSLSLVHRDGPWNIDLHTSLNRRCTPGATLVKLDDGLERRAFSPWPLATSASVLPPDELVLHLACHAGMDFVSLNLLRLTELVLVIRHAQADGTFSWERWMGLARRARAEGAAFPALHFANALLPGVIPAPILTTLERRAPALVRRVVARLNPATCHRLHRYSLKERFMWTQSLRGLAREVLKVLVPSFDRQELVRIHRLRLRLLANRSVSF